MPLKSDEVSLPENIKEIHVYDTREPRNRHLAYRIDGKHRKIEFFPYPQRDPFVLDRIIVEGFSRLPSDFSMNGYIKSGALYYLNKMISGKNVSKVTISRETKNSFRKYKDGYHVVLNYRHFNVLNERLARIKSDSKFDRSQFASEFFYTVFPRRYEKFVIPPERRITRLIANLDKNIISHLELSAVDKILDFFENMLRSKYKSAFFKRRLFSTAKIKVDDVALTDIINEFEKCLLKMYLKRNGVNFLRSIFSY